MKQDTLENTHFQYTQKRFAVYSYPQQKRELYVRENAKS
jgi:aspartyl/asparaginyl-tRNA synthetase